MRKTTVCRTIAVVFVDGLPRVISQRLASCKTTPRTEAARTIVDQPCRMSSPTDPSVPPATASTLAATDQNGLAAYIVC